MLASCIGLSREPNYISCAIETWHTYVLVLIEGNARAVYSVDRQRECDDYIARVYGIRVIFLLLLLYAVVSVFFCVLFLFCLYDSTSETIGKKEKKLHVFCVLFPLLKYGACVCTLMLYVQLNLQ